MSDLLDLAIEAHGGWQRWSEIRKLTARATIGGALWSLKGREGYFDDVRIDVDTRRQHTEYAPFGAPGRFGTWEPERTTVRLDDSVVVGHRDDPKASFEGHTQKWDEHHLLFFSGYAMWSYLTTPFLFRWPRMMVEEVEPWDERDGDTWRRLRVTFPDGVTSHAKVQTFYFDRSGMLMRLDYTAGAAFGLKTAQYVHDHKDFCGLVFPTRRLAYRCGDDNRPILDQLMVSIDLHAVDAR